MWLFVARGSSAEDVFKADPPLGISVGEYLERVMEVQHRNPIFLSPCRSGNLTGL